MISPLLTAVLSSVTAVAVTLLVNLFSLRREREADWRKLKLDRYQELLSSLSEKAGSWATKDSQVRYANAANSLVLIAPISVLNAFYRFQDEVTAATCISNPEDLNRSLSALIHEIRKDIGPNSDAKALAYRFFDIPKEDTNA